MQKPAKKNAPIMTPARRSFDRKKADALAILGFIEQKIMALDPSVCDWSHEGSMAETRTKLLDLAVAMTIGNDQNEGAVANQILDSVGR